MFELFTAWGFLGDYWPWLLGGSVLVVLAFVYAYFTGRIMVALEALAGLGVALAAGQIYRRGAASQKAQQDAANDKTEATTREVQAEVDGMSDEEVNRRLDRWIPPEETKR